MIFTVNTYEAKGRESRLRIVEKFCEGVSVATMRIEDDSKVIGMLKFGNVLISKSAIMITAQEFDRLSRELPVRPIESL